MLQKIQSSEMQKIKGITASDCFALFVYDKIIDKSDAARKAFFQDMDVVMVGYAGLSGSTKIAAQKEAELFERYSSMFIKQCADESDLKTKVAEAAGAVMSDECCAIEPLEGGIYAALWRMAAYAGVGLEVDCKRIPVKQETIEICNFYEINPYILKAENCMLIFTKQGYKLMQQMKEAGFPAEIIGKTTSENDRVVLTDEERSFLVKRYKDPLYEVLPELNPKKKKG